MSKSSNTCDGHGNADPRNCVGYAIKEVYLGNAEGWARSMTSCTIRLLRIRRSPIALRLIHGMSLSDLYVMPDRMESGDQVGLDPLFLTSGITRDLPGAHDPRFSLLYSTPGDAARRKWNIWRSVVMRSRTLKWGKNQMASNMAPEDYGALYSAMGCCHTTRLIQSSNLADLSLEGGQRRYQVLAGYAGKNVLVPLVFPRLSEGARTSCPISHSCHTNIIRITTARARGHGATSLKEAGAV